MKKAIISLLTLFFVGNLMGQIEKSAANRFFDEGLKKAKNKQYDAAIVDFDKAIALRPDFAKAYTNRGRVKIALKKEQEAFLDFNKAIELYPKDTLAYFYRAEINRKAGKPDVALPDYAKAAALDPYSDDIFTKRGMCLLMLSNIEDANKDFVKAIGINPNNAEANMGKGFILGIKENCTEAKKYFDKALSLNPSLSEAQQAKEKCEFLKDLVKKTNENSKTETKGQNSAAAINSFNTGNKFYQEKKYREAAAAYSRAIELDLSFYEAYENRGFCHQNLEKYADAVKDFKKCIALKPNNTSAMLNCIASLEPLERSQEAIALYDQLIALNGDKVEYFFGKSFNYLGLGNYQNAFDNAGKAILLNPNDARFYALRASAANNLDKLDIALSDLNKAISMNYFVQVYETRAMVFWKQDKKAEALKDFNFLLKKDPQNGDFLSAKGCLLVEMGKKDEAKMVLNEAVKYSKDKSFAQSCLEDLKKK